MILCGSTQKSEGTVELHFFFFVVASMTAKRQTPFAAYFPHVLFTPAGRQIWAWFCLILLLILLWFVRDGGGSSICRCCVVLRLVYSAGAKLVDPVGIDPIDPALVKVDEEHHVISEASYPVHHGHLDDKGKQVINEGIESLVGEHPPWEVGHRLHFVVDE